MMNYEVKLMIIWTGNNFFSLKNHQSHPAGVLFDENTCGDLHTAAGSAVMCISFLEYRPCRELAKLGYRNIIDVT